MIHFKRSLTIDAAPEAVWAVLSRFMHIDEFAPFITSVDALTEGENGVGSKRRNHFENGTSLVEEVIAWDPPHGFKVELSDMAAMPLHEARSGVYIEPLGERSTVTWTMEYRVKHGLFGWVLGQTVMKMMMKSIIIRNLKGLADKVRARQAAS